MSRPPKYDWTGTVLPAAAAFVESFDIGVTLRQCFYFLFSRGHIENTKQDYQSLSAWTTRARDAGRFPDFIDNGRWINRYPYTFGGSDDAHEWLRTHYRRDRAEFADVSIYLGVEKAGLAAQLNYWFQPLGIPILPLGGWSSQTFRESVRREIVRRRRPAVLIYAGDLDPSGAYIGQSFAEKVGAFTQVVRIGLNVDQLAGLPENPYPEKKLANPLIGRFQREFGPQLVARGYPELVQFELDALEPAQLRAIYRDGIRPYFDASAFMRSRDLEREDLVEIERRWAAA
ncbi:MAG: hypothetical protein H0V10_09720 [Geodermatophilaceae bacterium]|nr:hypothetical protein [Geodermatophilaceae bacterium]